MTECQTISEDQKDEQFICGVVEGFYGKPWTCEQRKDLFKRLRKLKLNSYMYAPKDDTKHRAKWRQLYSESEAQDLKTLIDEAKANGINFFYSLAPGLDMIYSEPRELKLLIEKYDQLVELGCESFAILFDDIEPTIINDKDKEMFKSYANAQIYVANIIFNHLKRPKFLFCPTEYCESRAVPDLANSIYLRSLGSGLQNGIDIMWSGSRVISRLITEESIDSLTKVIQRPPIIWENLHANDYDKKRVFLGPYSGRSTKIITKLRGVLTNPNCEFEANYIAIHTLANWSKCTVDINQNNSFSYPYLVQSGEFTPIGSKTAITTAKSTSQQHTSCNELIYDPSKALAQAIKDWLPTVLESKSLPSGVNLPSVQRNDAMASQELAKEDDCDVKDIDVEENSSMDVLADDSRLSVTSVSTNKSDMDVSGSLVSANIFETNSCDSCDMQVGVVEPTSSSVNIQDSSNSSSCESQFTLKQKEQQQRHQPQKEVDSIMSSADKIESTEIDLHEERYEVKLEDLNLLVDLFYLPFEHGFCGNELLQDIRWLRENHDILLINGDRSTATEVDLTTLPATTTTTTSPTYSNQNNDKLQVQMQMSHDIFDNNNPDINCKSLSSWMKRAEKLDNLCISIHKLVNKLIVSLPDIYLSRYNIKC